MPAEDPIRGILLAVGAAMLFVGSDTIAKVLSTQIPIIEIAWIRYVVFFGFAASLAWRDASREKTRMLAARRPALQVARGLCLVGASVLFIFGVRQMSMAQATSITFVAPLLITLLSIPILQEVVGLRRWIAVSVGLLGVLIVARPTSEFEPAALFGLASAFCWALTMVITRKMATIERPATTLLWSAGIGLIVLSVMLPFEYAWPTSLQFGLAMVLGCLASAGQWLVVLAHRQAPASVLAPFSYVELLWSVIAGVLFFASMPDRWMLVGAAIIIASGLYTAHRERAGAAAGRLRPRAPG